jgi:hypothetical protein
MKLFWGPHTCAIGMSFLRRPESLTRIKGSTYQAARLTRHPSTRLRPGRFCRQQTPLSMPWTKSASTPPKRRRSP